MRYVSFLLVSLLALAGCAPRVATPEKPAGPAKASDFSLRAIDGQTFRLSDYLGKDVILLSFWATWCVPCTAEMPALEKLHETYKDKGLKIVGISMDGPETIANVESTVRRYGATYPVVLDEETRVVAAYNPTRDAPFTVIIDRDGRIVESRLGYTLGDEVQLEKTLQGLLAAAPASEITP
jgi:peroxiredoxin